MLYKEEITLDDLDNAIKDGCDLDSLIEWWYDSGNYKYIGFNSGDSTLFFIVGKREQKVEFNSAADAVDEYNSIK